VEVEVPDSQQPSRRGKARGKATEPGPRQRATRAAARAPKEPDRGAAEEAEAAQALNLQREELLGGGLRIHAPFAGLEVEPGAEVVVGRPVPVVSPVAAIVDRRDVLAVFSIDTKILDAKKRLRAILRNELGYPSGRLPGDSGRFSSTVDPRVGVCHILAPTMAARCLRSGGYFR
jgi:hypothetical protein